MSRLCRLKTKSHGEDGKWAYNEIINLRQQIAESQAREVRLIEVLKEFGKHRPYCAINMTEKQNSMGGICNCGLQHQTFNTPPHAALEEYVMSRLEVVAFHHDDEGLSYENSFTGNVTLYRLKEKTKWQK